MTWIRVVEAEEASGKLKELYGQVVSPEGQIDNILKAHSLRPRTLAAHLELYKAALHSIPNGLSYRERELVGVCVSMLNGCGYCVEHHRAGLARHLQDPQMAKELCEAAAGRSDSEHLSPRERALCDYAIKLTRTPGDMAESDLKPLRAAGLSDEAILDLNQIVSYFAYANRTVLGLGVEIAGEETGLHPSEDSEGFKHA